MKLHWRMFIIWLYILYFPFDVNSNPFSFQQNKHLVSLSTCIEPCSTKIKNGNKKRETCGIVYKDFKCCLEYTKVKDGLIEYECLCCNKN